MTGHSRLHEFAPLGTVLRTLPGGVDSEVMLLKVELNRSKPGSSWSARWALPVHRQPADVYQAPDIYAKLHQNRRI